MNKDKAVIFLVNSLCNGGAERVVVNMANEYSKKYKVYIITLYDHKTYILNDNIEVISLYNSKLSFVTKMLKLPIIVKKINGIIKNIENNYNVILMTSHLIYSNLIAKLSAYNKSIINVIHVSYKVYDKKFHFLFRKCLQLLYNNTQIVTVSNGCKKELVEIYGIKPLNIETIYNPVNIDEIHNMMNEDCDINEPFILFAGRLDTPKRPDLLVDIYYQGAFYKKYKLCIAGVGPYEDLIKEKIKNYNIEKDVILLGWQMNVYKYMKNAKLFVNCSRNEAFPMSIIEALVCKCPVVSFDIDYGPNEILVDELNKFLAVDGDIDSMIYVMNKALKEYPSFDKVDIQKFGVSYINQKFL